MAELPPWMKGAKVVAKPEELRPAERPAVEFTPPQDPMSPAEATRLGFESTRLQMQQDAEQRTIADKERQRRELTETQSKGLGFYQRARSADVEFERLGLDPQSYTELLINRRSPNFSRAALSDERRAQLDAMENFIAATLRLESGAAISPEEFDKQARIFFPTPGAGPKEIEQKRKQRELAVRGFRAIAGEYGAEQADTALRDLGFIDEQGKPVYGEARQDGSQGRIVTAPGTTGGVVTGAIQGGQPIMTPQDMEAGKAIQEAWNRTGRFADVQAVAAQFGRSFGSEEAAFLQANEGKPVTINANPTGQPTAAEEAVGEFVSTPMGETVAAGMVSAASGQTFGLLDELAPILGLDADRVQAAKRYLQERNVTASLVGETLGSIGPAGLASTGVNAALAGTRLAPLAPLAGDAIAGILAGAGEANENRLGGAIGGGVLGAGAGALGRRVFGGGPDVGGPGGGVPAPTGPPTAGSGGRVSLSGAATPTETIRVTAAEDLPVPVSLMKFQKSRAFEESQRARELAKNNEVGGPIRERMAQQQQAIAANFDAFIDETGAQVLGNLEEQGARITAGIRSMADKSKAKYRALYKRAEAAGETREPVSYQPVLDAIAAKLPTEQDEKVLRIAREAIERNDPNGTGQLSIEAMEAVRKAVGANMATDANQARLGGEVKGIIDSILDDAGGDVYRSARAAFREHQATFKDVGIIAQLLGTKRNSTDRVVAAENVVARILAPGTEAAQLRKMRDLVTGEGGDPQAWAEVQGAVAEQIRRAAYPAGAVKDEAGQVAVSPAGLKRIIEKLDAGGKLNVIFDGSTAQGFRTLSDVAQDVFTAPPGSINFSNTTSAWENALDRVLNTLVTGLPVSGGVMNNIVAPLRKRIKERPLQKEVQQLIGEPTQ